MKKATAYYLIIFFIFTIWTTYSYAYNRGHLEGYQQAYNEFTRWDD